MPSADFCFITGRVTPDSAIGLYLVRSLRAIHPKESRHLLTRALLVVYRSLVKQISPDKNVNCPRATASFTVAVRSHGFVVLCQLAFSLASYDVLVHQFAVLRPASSGLTRAGKPLPFTSSYRLLTTWFSTVIFLQRTFTSLVRAHAGRTQVAALGKITR